jgi:hypothetical protein
VNRKIEIKQKSRRLKKSPRSLKLNASKIRTRKFGADFANMPILVTGFVTATSKGSKGGQGLIRSHVAATASNHCAAASALKIRSVDREMRWR